MLYVYRSNRLEQLADALVDVLQDPLPSPMDQEWICVQTQGISLWLGMRLSRQLGVWANAYHPFPRVVIESLFSSALDREDNVPYSAETNALAWGIMAILPHHLDRPEFSSLKHYLADDDHGVKRYQLSCRIGRAFDQYAVYRPDMVLAWEAGLGTKPALAPEQRWQPILWRAFWKHLGSGHAASVFQQYLSALTDGKAPLSGLPPRLSFFGISTLPPLYLRALEALPQTLPVHLFILSPSREFWADIRSRKQIERNALKQAGDGASFEGDAYLEEGHPLLATLGHLGREFQVVLEENTRYVEPRDDLYEDPAMDDAGNMLSILQSDMLNLNLRRNGSTPPLPVSRRDRSIEIHVCHSPMREIQILKDQLLNMLDEDSSLYPHDIIVMAPNIETYAPFIEAVFNADAKTPQAIPYTVSDRQLIQDVAVIRAFMGFVRLARSRLSIQEVIDFLSLEPVRERFDLTEEEVGTGIRWFNDAGIRWGIDGNHRTEVGQPNFYENTWQFGLDRLLVGVAMPEDHSLLFDAVLPYTKIQGKEAESLGKLADFCERLFDAWRRCQSVKSAGEWQDTFLQALSNLVACRPETESHHQLIRQACQALVADSMGAGFEEPLHLDVVERWIADWLNQRTATSGFLSGGVTFCNLLPMRSIPFKIVYLIGMNDLDFPRRKPSMGFDLTEWAPRPGDRSVRQDDRYLFLEALLSARSRFVTSYVGYDIQDNSPKPPSVVVDELLDALCDGFFLDTGLNTGAPSSDDFRDHIVTRHFLHPFHANYFLSEKKKYFSYSPAFFAGAVAAMGEKKPPPCFLPMAMPMAMSGVRPANRMVRLQDLLQFFRMPVRFFLKHRLGISLQDDADGLDTREPMLPDALERFDMGEFMLKELLAGQTPENIYHLLRAAGKLPLGKAGRSFYEEMAETVTPIADEVSQRTGEEKMPPLSVDVEIEGVRISGVLGNRWSRTRLLATTGRLSAYRKLSFWIEHLLLSSMAEREVAGPSILLGRGNNRVEMVAFPPVPDQAAIWLSELVRLFLRGQTEPLRFFPNSSHAFALAWHRATGANQAAKAWKAARNAWRGNERGAPGEGADLSIGQVFGGSDPLTDDIEDTALSFQQLSLEVFSPLLAALENGATTVERGRP